ncbi:unnamed protein product [Linum trigynum]|uniref:Uncharacterized protein n=1 Tax=Linum trigynum TaxID=586398 RepID=A0AAV2GT61_9ROSI
MAESLIKVETTSTHRIKPSIPTPSHLETFNLFLLDQLSPVAYASLVLFYTTKSPIIDLKPSLSQALTQFYPLAGRINDESGSSIHCNDQGAIFIESQSNCFLSQVLQNPDPNLVRRLIPVETEAHEEAYNGSPLLIQVTSFACDNGFSIGVCLSQKVGDATTLVSFIRTWAELASGKFDRNCQKFPPLSNSASSIFPPRKLSFTRKPSVNFEEKCVTKRFVFNSSKIAALKWKSAAAGGWGFNKTPTRIESVTGLIWKCAMNAARSNSDHHSILSILAQSADMRTRIHPPLPEPMIGNLAGYFASQAIETDLIDLGSLVGRLRKGIEEFDEDYCESFEEARVLLEGGDVDLYVSINLCGFELYDDGLDFGFGRPVWVTVPTGASCKNFVAIWDARDGDGIEAWVTLSEDDMAYFEKDRELLDWGVLNPSVLGDFVFPMSSL